LSINEDIMILANTMTDGWMGKHAIDS